MNVAQINIGRILYPVDDPRMAGFMNRLDEINAIADRAPGFVWRLQTEAGNATYFRPYPEDDRILLNMSVWESIDTLRDYVYRTLHKDLIRDRHLWFEKFSGVFLALWWVPDGHTPTIEEAKERLAHLEKYGPTARAFTFQTVVPPEEALPVSAS